MIGSGLPAPKGPARAIVATISLLAAAAVTAAVDQQRIFAPRRLDGGRERVLEIGAEGVERDPFAASRPPPWHGRRP